MPANYTLTFPLRMRIPGIPLLGGELGCHRNIIRGLPFGVEGGVQKVTVWGVCGGWGVGEVGKGKQFQLELCNS